MKATYHYNACGTAAGGQTWEVSGSIALEGQGSLFDAAMRDAFQQLTQGKAIYGQPGVGCVGPYNIDRFSIVKEQTP